MRCTLNLKQHNFIREKVLNRYKQQFIQSTIELKVFAQDRKRTQTFCAVNTKECISFGYRKRCLLVLEFVSMQRGQISSITVWDTSTKEAAYRTPQPRKQPIGHLNQGSSLFGHLNRGSSHRTTDHLGATHRSITEASNIATVPEHISLRINSIDLDFVCYINCRCNMANTQESVQLKSLRRQRASIKGQLTRIETYLKEGEHVEVHDLQIRKERVVELGKSFEEVQLGIELEDEVSNHDIEREQFERNYFKIVSTINRQLEGLRPSNAATSSVRKADSPNTVMIKQENTLLPKIEIKPYDGNPIEWHSFHDTFKTLVHDNLDIPSVQKFHLLKNALRGEIASVVSALNASEPNYLVAWDLLQKRCNKPRQIVQSHLKVLFELPEVMRDAPANLRSLAEQAQMHVKALATLGLPTGQWDAILVYMIGKKLDKITRRGWERTLENEDMPTFEQLLNFINKQARGEEIEIEVLSSHRRNVYQERSQRNNVGSRGHSYVATANSNKCVMCEGNHEIYQCNQFLKAAVRDRLEVIRRSRLCINCFRSNHVVKNCQATGCRKCKQKHNTLLHFNNENRVNLNNNSTQAVDQAGNSGSNANALTVTCGSEVLLGTAQIKILDRFNKEHDCRVLLDGGSQTHFITEELAEKLQLQKQAVNLTFSGLGQQATKAQYLVKTVVKARHSSFTSQVSFITLPFLTGLLPSRQVDRSNMQVPRNIKLADPEFHKPGKIDALLGNTLFFKLLSIGQIRLSNSAVILQKTLLGWIVTGESNIQPKYRAPTLVNSFHIATSLDKTLNKFWEVESFVDKQFLSAEERAAEELFKQSTVRDTDGRYCVRLPFNERKQLLGNSREVALKRFYALERKLHLNKGLLDSYSEFLKEYEQLGHMTQVSVKETSKGFYLPHHAVVKESSETTKVRVVFDASAKSSTGVSLNETLLIGPNLQDTLYKLLLRFRSYSYVLTADIEKMFRQVKVHAEDRSYQRILWRNSQDQPVKTYELNTVTYGTASAPFLAVRCLQQLANDEQNKFPRAAAIFKRDFYMDDLLTGAATRDLALKIRDEAIALARVGGFNLRQWTSNDAELIKDLDTSNHERTLSLDIDETRKALGICWKPRIDEILYTIKSSENNSRSTKRTILSQIAQLFDPLGLLGPVIVRAKIIMQELWKANINWDDSVPQAILTMWLEFRKELPHLNKFSIPRKTVIDDPVTVQLHGFADASEAAYGACIYLRSVNKQGSCKVSLLCAKSRVAPVKSISLPRLELCAAKLLANLLKESRSALSHIRVERTVLWSDSTITLHWIKTSPHLLKTFIANRVSEIQEQTDVQAWRHISSPENPADFISRGLTPVQILNNQLWLKGPHWLSKHEDAWPSVDLPDIDIPETRNFKVLVASLDTAFFIDRFSSINKLNRVLAYILRFYNNCKGNLRITGELTNIEITNAHIYILKLVQAHTFEQEIRDLKNNTPINKKSKLLNLAPFIDGNGLLRVGGRLKHAHISYSHKHPIVLPRRHYITELIIREEHLKNWHAGIQATLNAVRHKYWPIDGKNFTRKIIHRCINCFKANPKVPEYIMGNLPRDRVTQARPFENAATHLELVTDLTTETCIAAIKRFFARRGKSRNLYSDNGSNFVGARNEIIEIQAFVNWSFSPPRSPHFGGLWEAAVKSFKKHLRATIGETVFTYEQFNSIIIEIEAILNSRPLTPLSSDPNDCIALTPAHFLIGGSLQTLPEYEISDIRNNRLSLWQHTQKIKQHFWNRWHREYLHELHTRSKWHVDANNNIKEGMLVLIREDNLAPLQWKLGRIMELHPGEDKIIRVVSVRTPLGIYKRSVKKLAPLPIEYM
ncbi:uncharacterized protein LOC143187904 [Calliopsis andreniformis]|uniref:uncharacterized protein LOC143187904 n=1 Tax=Calliopsis andreniformis TaxID=337506 RepID=UPI003FCD1EE4